MRHILFEKIWMPIQYYCGQMKGGSQGMISESYWQFKKEIRKLSLIWKPSVYEKILSTELLTSSRLMMDSAESNIFAIQSK